MTKIGHIVRLLLVALLLVPHAIVCQSSFKSVSLRKVSKYGGRYTDKTVKIPNVVLEDVRGFENDWPHLFQLYDPRDRFRRGAFKENENPCCIQEFSIFADVDIGKSLLRQKAEWFGKLVNVYISIQDRGLTPRIYIGYVVRVELLNENGKVAKAIPEGE